MPHHSAVLSLCHLRMANLSVGVLDVLLQLFPRGLSIGELLLEHVVEVDALEARRMHRIAAGAKTGARSNGRNIWGHLWRMGVRDVWVGSKLSGAKSADRIT